MLQFPAFSLSYLRTGIPFTVHPKRLISTATMAPTLDHNANDDDSTCFELSVNDIVFSRTTLIIVLTLCVAITGLSLLAIATLGYREWNRRQQDKEARSHGRNSKYLNRISIMRKEVDSSYSRQYSGCLVNEPENPFLAPRSPVELMHTPVWEVPDSSPPTSTTTTEEERGAKAKSLLYDNEKGQWFRRHS